MSWFKKSLPSLLINKELDNSVETKIKHSKKFQTLITFTLS